MKNLVILAFIIVSIFSADTFSSEQETCPITVRLEGDFTPLKGKDLWPGNFKIGFEVYGIMKLRTIEANKLYQFDIPCHDSYVRFHIDYNTYPFVGELNINMSYQGKESILKIDASECFGKINTADSYRICNGFKEKMIDNITLR